MTEQPICEDLRLSLTFGMMRSPVHSLMIRPYMFGQYRLQLTRKDVPHPFASEGHGGIVREMCTYNTATAMITVQKLREAADPEAYCRSLEREWNCERPGRGRIRLDNTLADRPEIAVRLARKEARQHHPA